MNKFLINQNSSLIEALIKIKKNGVRELLVTNDNNILVGSISDGDIRDYLIKFKKIQNVKISSIMNKKPFYVFKSDLDIKLINKFLENALTIIPVLDKNKKILEVLNKNFIKFYPKLINANDNNVVIMSGGYGKRMKPFTDIFPKALVPVNDSSIIEIIIEKFISENFHNIYISTFYKHRLLKDFLNIKFEHLNLKFIQENKPLGTIGSLSKLDNSNKPVIITNCDNIFNFKFLDVLKYHYKKKSDFTIVVTSASYQSPYGICKINKNKRLINFEEKPTSKNLINVGFYIVDPKVIHLIPKNKFYGIDQLILKSFKENIKIFTYQIEKKDYSDFGRWEEYKSSINI